jgi:hypothetical protein
MAKSRPGTIHLQIVEAMKRFPDGITGGQIRLELGLRPEDQTHLDRRKRDLKKWFLIEKTVAVQPDADGTLRKVVLYRFRGERTGDATDSQVNSRLRAMILRSAHGRCQMCGRTIEKHGIVLVVDHKRPQDWGGTNDPDNLWAICEECNGGKKAYFSSVDVNADLMKRVMAEQSVHVRIGETLKAFGIGKPVPAYLLDLIADQEDWQKRLRELRYPVIGWDYDYQRYKENGRVRTNYILKSFLPWPNDPTATIRKFEKEREERNRALGRSTGFLPEP